VEAEDRADTVVRYRERLSRHGYSPQALGWDKGNQGVRFAAVLEALGSGFGSLLDVGCGLGDLFGQLRDLGWRGRYLGLDIVPEFLVEARRRFGAEGAEFRELEIDADELDESFDVAVAIGIFNHRTRQDPWQRLEATLGTLWTHTRTAVAVDFLSGTAVERREDLRYWDAGEVLRLGLRLSKRVSLAHDYMPFEFLLALWHDDSFTRACPVFSRAKGR
jgi:SAM-dependent methyltransferase